MKISELKTEELEQACVDYQVKELYVFGSAVTGQITQNSDLDFLWNSRDRGLKVLSISTWV